MIHIHISLFVISIICEQWSIYSDLTTLLLVLNVTVCLLRHREQNPLHCTQRHSFHICVLSLCILCPTTVFLSLSLLLLLAISFLCSQLLKECLRAVALLPLLKGKKQLTVARLLS